ncbi:MAG: zinc-binding dehydrogenase [Candidatus Acidiferrales bacterium]
MKAVVFSEHGGPNVLHYTDLPEPTLGAKEALVRVRACALNHLGIWIRRGLPGVAIALPHVLGSDIGGEVAKTGEGVSTVRAGDRVLLAPRISCGATTGFEGAVDIRYLFSRNLSIIGTYMGGKGELFAVLDLVDRGLLKPVIDRVMPLEQATQAHERLENREHFGKIVLQIP